MFNSVVILLGLIVVHIYLNIDKSLGCRLYLGHVQVLLFITVVLCIGSSAYERYDFNLGVDLLSFVSGGFLVLYSKGTQWLGSLSVKNACSVEENPFALLCFVLGDFMVFGSLYRLCILLYDTKNRMLNIGMVVVMFIIIASVYSFVVVDLVK